MRTDASFDHRAVERLPETTVATIDGDVVGFTVIVDDEAEQVYVDRAARGSGIAALLLADVERQVAANGHSRAWLAVAAGNARARRFYERSGWVDDGGFDYQADGPDGPIAVRVTATCGISEPLAAGSQNGRARAAGLAEWSRRG